MSKKSGLDLLLLRGDVITIFVTAPEFVWKDFIEKRNMPQAHGEIRKFAKTLEKAIFPVPVI